MNQEEISKSLINTIKSPELEALATDFSEIAIDQLSEVEGVAKEVPIIGSIVKVIRLGFSIKDIHFLKKLGMFLWHLREVPCHERVKLIKKLEEDSKYKADVGSKIMMLLDRVDHFEKPMMIANAFKAYLNNEITYSQLQRINFAIDHLFMGDIDEFRAFYNKSHHVMDEYTHKNLELAGFVDLDRAAVRGTSPKINKLGRKFAERVLMRGKD
jgi:hypothetical protein